MCASINVLFLCSIYKCFMLVLGKPGVVWIPTETAQDAARE